MPPQISRRLEYNSKVPIMFARLRYHGLFREQFHGSAYRGNEPGLNCDSSIKKMKCSIDTGSKAGSV